MGLFYLIQSFLIEPDPQSSYNNRINALSYMAKVSNLPKLYHVSKH